MSTTALIPARSGSKGIPGKNLRELGGASLIEHAIACAKNAGIAHRVVSTDIWPLSWPSIGLQLNRPDESFEFIPYISETRYLQRPAELAQDDTPMYAVVQHAAEALKLQPEDSIVLLQPTQPFRKPEHVRKALELLHETQADSVVSVVPLPLTHSPELVCTIWNDGRLRPALGDAVAYNWRNRPTRRQDVDRPYRPDGTVYAFFRKTLDSGTIYGAAVRPLILDPSESCELDTELDWIAVEKRWQELHG